MYRMSLISMFAPTSLASKIDISRCMKMALVHDMAEALVGDITPVDGVPKVEKNRREATTMDYFANSLLGRVNNGLTGKEMRAIWQEYEDGETLESKFVHEVDKFELVLQMVDYEKAHNWKLDLGEFSWVSSRITMPEVKAWSDEVLKEREIYWGGREHSSYASGGLEQVKLDQKREYYGDAEPNGKT
jgi:putative hydrolase of HD superfamily